LRETLLQFTSAQTRREWQRFARPVRL